MSRRDPAEAAIERFETRMRLTRSIRWIGWTGIGLRAYAYFDWALRRGACDGRRRHSLTAQCRARASLSGCQRSRSGRQYDEARRSSARLLSNRSIPRVDIRRSTSDSYRSGDQRDTETYRRPAPRRAARMTEQRRLAAIVSADVAGYSRLMGRDESGTLAALKALRQEVVDPAIASHGGRIVKTTGDGLLLEFPSVVNAVRCAVEVQTAMADRTAEIAEDRRIAFRVGINIGDIIVEGDDIFGDGVNVAARLQEIAAPGGICISSRVHEDVRDRLDTAFDDGGTQTLKNIARPVQVWRWQPGTAVPPKPAPAPTALPLPDKPSIAVLPFQNMSGDPEQEYFADGIVEDIITELSRFRELFVIARNQFILLQGQVAERPQVGRELGVRYVLEGSVRKAGNRIRVTGQLVDTQTGRSHLGRALRPAARRCLPGAGRTDAKHRARDRAADFRDRACQSATAKSRQPERLRTRRTSQRHGFRCLDAL